MLDHALINPCHGAVRIEQELRLKGIQVFAGGIRGVWQRHALLTKHERLLRLEKATAEGQRTWFETIDEMQAVLDDFLVGYNQRRPHQGRGMNGRTPAQAFIQGLPKPQQQKEDKRTEKKSTKQAA